MKARRVMVLLDGTRDSTVAIPVARRFAVYGDADLLPIHMDRRLTLSKDEAARLGWDPDESPGLVLPRESGSFVESVDELCRRYEVESVVFSSRFGATHNGDLSPIAETLLNVIEAPVVIVPADRTGADWRLCHMLLPHDGTPVTAAAIGPSVRLLEKASGAEMVVLHVASLDHPRSSQPGAMELPYYVDQPQYDWPAWADEFLQRLRAVGGGVPEEHMRLLVAIGDPGDMILERMRDLNSDLTVLSWQGTHASRRARTLRKVLAASSAPVMVIRSQEARTERPWERETATGEAPGTQREGRA